MTIEREEFLRVDGRAWEAVHDLLARAREGGAFDDAECEAEAVERAHEILGDVGMSIRAFELPFAENARRFCFAVAGRTRNGTTVAEMERAVAARRLNQWIGP